MQLPKAVHELEFNHGAIYGPEEAAAFNDLVAQVLAAHTPLHGRVLELRLAGYGPSEIAEQLGVTRQTVHRHLTRLGDWLRAAVGSEPDPETPQ